MRRRSLLVATLAFAPAIVTAQDTPLALSTATQSAVAISPAVQSARSRVAETQALLDAAQRSAGPQAVASYVLAPQGTPTGTISQSLTTVGGQYSFSDAYARTPVVAQARADAAVARADLHDAERQERVKTIDRYYDALRAQADAIVRARLVDDAKRDLDAARARYRAGDAPRLDIVRAEVDLTRADSELDGAHVAAADAADALGAETGLNPARFVAAASLPAPGAPLERDDVLVARALAQRTDLGAAREAVATQQAAVDAAKRSGAPNVALTAGYTQGADAGFFVRGPSATLQVGVPVGGPAPARAQAERERVRQAQLRVEQLERDIRLEVLAARRAAEAAVRAVRTTAATAAAAAAELQAVRLGYQRGASSSLDVSEARRIEAEASIDMLNARYAEARARAQLMEVTGS